MEDIIKFVENAGFIVTNKEDFSKIEIRYSKNNNELLERFFSDSTNFYGTSGRNVCLCSNYVEINLGKGINITKNNSKNRNHKSRSKYEINYMIDKNNWCNIDIECVFADEKNAGNISVKIDTHGYTKETHSLNIVQEPLSATFYYNDSPCTPINIEKCNPKLYLEEIVEFFHHNDFVSRYTEIQEAIKIVLSSVNDDIEKLFTSYIENIDKYIKILENEKEEYQTKIATIDIGIETLKNISKNKQIIKRI